ncbi:methyl-accepting chemotaxis protein [Achromobacter sp. DH1f]|uniref:methyl-accepting chemotaxis protein n=1 Tax=Achromobacter sp. DH1f TaxID=1397275 RepID=UPI0005B2F3BD|nr:methyl-accepting chemotaxis protein [Achromobacter sp. DH1f]
MSSIEHKYPTSPADVNDGFFKHHGFWALGVRAFRNLNFQAKAIIISSVFLLPMLLLVSWLLHYQYESIMKERENSTRQNVEIAFGLLQYAHNLEVAGTLTRDAAQDLAISLIKPLRYDHDEYFWINDVQRRMIMHPINPQLNGQDMSNYIDANGIHVFREFAALGEDGGTGFLRYQWAKPNHAIAEDKISYVRGFAPWGWVIGSGIYVSDVWESLQSLIGWTSLMISITLAIGLYLFLSFYHVMNGGLQETRRHLRAMTTGDLTTSPKPWGKDEAADLMFDLLNMQNSLRTMVQHVRHSSIEMLHSSREIANGASDLSNRTEHTASDLEESAAGMEEVTATISQNSQHTQEAERVAVEGVKLAMDGGNIMRNVATTIGEISESSQKIARIAGTIDGIAFQTNILALNAAVESARAGEQGRGFAVVASEVRVLALRTAASAKEVGNLINHSVSKVIEGVSVVTEAGDLISKMELKSQNIKTLLSEIANGAREQDIGVRHISQAVNDLDRMTQQNAALAEETAAAAQALEQQAFRLKNEVARFILPVELSAG